MTGIITPARRRESGLNFTGKRSELDIFLALGKGYDLARNRLLGVVGGADIEQEDDIESFLRENLELDFENIINDPIKIQSVVARFFRAPDAHIVRTGTYRDPDVDEVKKNLLIVTAAVHEQEQVCYLKYCEEGPRRESLGMRINNLLTDRPVPFMASGFTALQLGIPGPTLDLLHGVELGKQERFDYELGKTQEYTRLLQLGDRKTNNIIYTPDGRIVNIDFGAAFSRFESIGRYAYDTDGPAFAQGMNDAQDIIRSRYEKHKDLVEKLLEAIDDDVIREMNEENERQTYLVTTPPKDIVHNYLESITA